MESIELDPKILFGSLFFISTIIFGEMVHYYNLDAQHGKQYKPFSHDPLPETVVVDCKHPTAPQLTHHLKGKNERANMNLRLRGDTSTDAVINAIKKKDLQFIRSNFVSSNHFDIDSFLSVWCAVNPRSAKINEQLIREIAKIGDFRELR